MNRPELHPRKSDPAAAPRPKPGPRQTLRVLAAEAGSRTAAPSIEMPRAKTELSALLAGDAMICVRRRTPSTAAPVQPAGAPSAADLSAAPAVHPEATDGELARLVAAWPSLPRNVRAAIVALVGET